MNTWFWKSVEEFTLKVLPIERAPKSAAITHRWDNFSIQFRDFHRNLEQLRKAHEDLESVLASNRARNVFDEHEFSAVMHMVMELVLRGEYVLALCRPLAYSARAEAFIASKEVSQRLPELQESGFSAPKLLDLHETARALLDEADDFLIHERNVVALVDELPGDLKADFICAEHLSSLGFDEAALIYCGRAFEGVVRRIAANHKIGVQPVERARFFEILKELEKKRVSSDNSLVIDEQTKHLLHYSRTVRNQSAHPSNEEAAGLYQEQCKLMAGTAGRLWRKCSAPGVQIV